MYLGRPRAWGEQREQGDSAPLAAVAEGLRLSLFGRRAVRQRGSRDERISQAVESGGLGRQGGHGGHGGHASGHASGGGVEWVQNNVKLRT